MKKLIVYKNRKEIQCLDLDPGKEYLAGRSQSCDILLDDNMFSRQHFKLFYTNGAWTVQGLSKYSQIKLNEKDLDYFTLKDKDRFKSFDFEFVFVDEQEHTIESKPLDENSTQDDKTVDIKESLPLDAEALDLEEENTFVPEMSSQEWSVGIAYLIIHQPSGASTTLRLEGDYWVLGRDENCDIVIDDPKASREHCEIFKKNNSYFILDKKSSNGTLLNFKKLAADTHSPLMSSDQIQIGKFLIIFEIRDPLFTEKVSHLPMTRDEALSPLPVDFSMDESLQKVVRISPETKNKNKMYLIGGALLILVMAFYFSGNNSSQNKNLSSTQAGAQQNDPFSSLSNEQKDFIEKTYTLAKTLYTQGKYEVALTEIEKIKAIIPSYKDSNQIAQYSKSAIDTLMEQRELANREAQQQALAQKVDNIITQCQNSYNKNLDSSALEDCLSSAIELDPENSRIKQLRITAEENDNAKEQRIEQKNVYNSRVRNRKKIFEQAERLQREGKLLDAISVYGRHIASTLPDPDHLEGKSKKRIHELESKVNDDVAKLKSEAKNAHDKKDYRQAITKLELAVRLNPQDGSIRSLHDQYSKELLEIVKNLYSDSVIDENLGNIETAKEKWKKILNTDMEYGDYYKKASVKLKKY